MKHLAAGPGIAVWNCWERETGPFFGPSSFSFWLGTPIVPYALSLPQRNWNHSCAISQSWWEMPVTKYGSQRGYPETVAGSRDSSPLSPMPACRINEPICKGGRVALEVTVLAEWHKGFLTSVTRASVQEISPPLSLHMGTASFSTQSAASLELRLTVK